MSAVPSESAAAEPLELSPFCRHLGSKKLCFRTGPPQEELDVLDASRHVWCRRTHQALGPDADAVDTAECRRGRSCFEPF